MLTPACSANNPLLEAVPLKFPTAGHAAADLACLVDIRAALAATQLVALGLFHNLFVPGLRTSCGPNWYTGGSSNNSYILALFVTCFVMPLSLILFSYANLLMTLRAVSVTSTGELMVFCSQNAGKEHLHREEEPHSSFF